MDKTQILKSLDKKSNGEIYLGVVGAVRTGKSTFIKRCIETLILPYMETDIEKKRCMDEIPQTASGKTIMTIEPKFVPTSDTKINIDGLVTNIKLVEITATDTVSTAPNRSVVLRYYAFNIGMPITTVR